MLDSGHCDKAVDAQLYWYETLYFSLSLSLSLTLTLSLSHTLRDRQ